MKGIEIEKKYLVKTDNISSILNMAINSKKITQAYLEVGDTERRVRKKGNKYFYTIKQPVKTGNGLIRKENEIEITSQEYEERLNEGYVGNIIDKTRYTIPLLSKNQAAELAYAHYMDLMYDAEEPDEISDFKTKAEDIKLYNILKDFDHAYDIISQATKESAKRGSDLIDIYREKNYVAELDVFKGALSGLVSVEVEFDSEKAAEEFEFPEWFSKDVTEDKTYKNQKLATNGIPESAKDYLIYFTENSEQ